MLGRVQNNEACCTDKSLRYNNKCGEGGLVQQCCLVWRKKQQAKLQEAEVKMLSNWDG